MRCTQETLVSAQFGPQAEAYVSSTVHAQGEDLERLARFAAGLGAANVLDLGCGGGHGGFSVAPHVRSVIAYDLSEEMLDVVRRVAAERSLDNIRTVPGVVEKLPFEDATFDLVVTRFSAHHWSDVRAGAREAARVLAPNGRAVFIDIASSESPLLDTHLQAIELLRDASHVRDYAPSEWRAFLTAAGFRILVEHAHKLRLDFAPWIARMRTPELRVEAIRSLQRHAAGDVARYFDIAEDGSFTSDVIYLELCHCASDSPSLGTNVRFASM